MTTSLPDGVGHVGDDGVAPPGPRWATVVLIGLSPALVLAVAILAPWSSGVSYYVALLVQLAAVVIVGRWTRTLSLARRRPSRPEQVGAGVALFASGVTWWLVRLVAQGHGIQGSAWRRVRRGIPLPHDHVYLAASGAAIVGVLCALALLLTFMRTAPIGSQRPD